MSTRAIWILVSFTIVATLVACATPGMTLSPTEEFTETPTEEPTKTPSKEPTETSTLVAPLPNMPGDMWSFEELRIAARQDGRLGSYVLSFGQDADLELYLMTHDTGGPAGDTGKVFKIVPSKQG